MNDLRKALIAIGVVVAFAAPRYASAQTAQSLEQLQVLVKDGDTVWVTDSAGNELQGRIDKLTSSTLRLKSKGVDYDFTEMNLRKIRHSDSLVNGTLIGAGVGAGFGGLGLIVFCLNDACGAGAAFETSWAGIGALMGLGIDAIRGHKKTIYRSPSSSPLTRIRVAPLAGRKARGVLLSMSF